MKNNTIIKKIGVLSALVCAGSILLESCKKEWLQPETLSGLAVSSTLVDAPAFKSALASINNNIRPEWYGDASPIISEQLFSEESVEGTNDKAGPANDMIASITPSSQLDNTDFNRIGWYFRVFFNSVRAANIIIDQLPNATQLNDSLKNLFKGQALFHRAYALYRLTNQFGDLPITMSVIKAPKTDYFSVKREVILAMLKTDLDFAVKYVPWKMDGGDVNRGACYHLLTKVNLALGLFDDAIASANALINSGQFKLMTARFGVDAANTKKNITWDLHRPENKGLANNTEAIYLVTDRASTPGAFGASGTNTYGTSQIMRNFVPGYALGTISTPDGKTAFSTTTLPGSSYPSAIDPFDNFNKYGRGIGRCRSTSYFYNDIWDSPTDQRHDSTSGNWMYIENLTYNDQTLKSSNSPWYGKRVQMFAVNGDPTSKRLCTDTLRAWYPWPNYKTVVLPDLENPTQPRGGATDYYVFRLAETYLLRAEAYLWKGDAASAMADINTIRNRAGATAYTDVSKIDIGAVLDERARELYIEEPRKTELTRIAYLFAKTGKPYRGKSYTVANFSTDNFWYDRVMEKNSFYKNQTPVTNSAGLLGPKYRIAPYHVLWPIPIGTIQANVDGHINQNPGYPGSETNVPPLDQIPAK
jgi:hypothetical protein